MGGCLALPVSGTKYINKTTTHSGSIFLSKFACWRMIAHPKIGAQGLDDEDNGNE